MNMKDENKEKVDIELITAYAQMAFFTLQNSGTEITPKAIKSEIKIYYQKLANKELKRLANIIMKEKRQNK